MSKLEDTRRRIRICESKLYDLQMKEKEILQKGEKKHWLKSICKECGKPCTSEGLCRDCWRKNPTTLKQRLEAPKEGAKV